MCAHTFIAHTALDPNARLVLLDPNQVQFHHWQECTGLPVIGPNTLDAVRALETVQQHMQQRFAELQDTGQWIPGPDDPTYTVVIDEATKYIDRSTKQARELVRAVHGPRARHAPTRPRRRRPPHRHHPTPLSAKSSRPTSAPSSRTGSGSASAKPKPRK